MTDSVATPSIVARAATAVAEQTSAGWTFLMALMPSINQTVGLLVAAAISAGVTHKIVAPAPAKTEVAVPVDPITSEVLHRLTIIEGVGGLCVDEVQALRKEWKGTYVLDDRSQSWEPSLDRPALVLRQTRSRSRPR